MNRGTGRTLAMHCFWIVVGKLINVEVGSVQPSEVLSPTRLTSVGNRLVMQSRINNLNKGEKEKNPLLMEDYNIILYR